MGGDPDTPRKGVRELNYDSLLSYFSIPDCPGWPLRDKLQKETIDKGKTLLRISTCISGGIRLCTSCYRQSWKNRVLNEAHSLATVSSNPTHLLWAAGIGCLSDIATRHSSLLPLQLCHFVWYKK